MTFSIGDIFEYDHTEWLVADGPPQVSPSWLVDAETGKKMNVVLVEWDVCDPVTDERQTIKIFFEAENITRVITLFLLAARFMDNEFGNPEE